MGFFSKLFGTPQPPTLAQRLVAEYAACFAAMGAGATEGRKLAEQMVAEAQQIVRQRGLDREVPNAGSWLLQNEHSNSDLKTRLDRLRACGIRDSDIRWWWDLPPLERVMIERADELNRTSLFLSVRRQGGTADDAGRAVWQAHPRFGEVSEQEGEDGLLPIELKRRIVEFMEKRPDECSAQATGGSRTFNAFVWAKIREGVL